VTRRDLIALLGSTAVSWPVRARAQQQERMRRIGVLMAYADGPLGRSYTATFRRALEKTGWAEGRNIQIDERWGGGDADRLRLYAVELVDLKPDVIFAGGGRAIDALKQQTRNIPIVFEGPSDPVRQGFVASMARPGGNLTGFSAFEPSVVGKLVEALREIAPRTARVALMVHPDNPGSPLYMELFETAVSLFGMKGMAAPARDPSEIAVAIGTVAKMPNGALMLAQDNFMVSQRDLIVRHAAEQHLPAIYPLREYVTSGGLLSYGADTADRYLRAASYVDRIMRGEKPADLSVQAPTKYELVINLKTAKALGLDVPATLLARADEVIE
jgi:putative tryptophan/tyrosine transport system substrate-binding protein